MTAPQEDRHAFVQPHGGAGDACRQRTYNPVSHGDGQYGHCQPRGCSGEDNDNVSSKRATVWQDEGVRASSRPMAGWSRQVDMPS